jgi:S1-C subfamily serine protease
MLGMVLRDMFAVEVNISVNVQQRAEMRSGRRPMPQAPQSVNETFVIDDSEPEGSRMGTTFAIDNAGVWLTAAHVTRRCSHVGLVTGGDVQSVSRVMQSLRDDVTLMIGGLRASESLRVSGDAPAPGAPAYHMGFPEGEPAVIASQFLGSTTIRHHNHEEAQMVWAEGRRMPEFDGELGGASGGPVLAADGSVIGVISASTPRRGRILTVPPHALISIISASRAVTGTARPVAIRNAQHALDRFTRYLQTGVIREVYCGVN